MVLRYNFLDNVTIKQEFQVVLDKKIPELHNFIQSEGYQIDINDN